MKHNDLAVGGGDLQLDETDCVKPVTREKNFGIVAAKAEWGCEVGRVRVTGTL